MPNSELLAHKPCKGLEGIHPTQMDDKHRIRVPHEWQEYFIENKTIILLYTGQYAIMVTREVFDSYPANPDLIIHTEDIDNTNRFLIPSHFQKAFGIILEESVYLIGKGNHIEIYFSSESFEKTKNKSLQAAISMQVELIQQQKS